MLDGEQILPEAGEIIFISEDTMLTEEIEEEYNKMDNASEQFIAIPERDSSENFRDMEDFVLAKI